MLKAFDLLAVGLSLFRARAMRPETSLPGPFHVAAVLLAHPEEAPLTVAGELQDAAVAPTAGTGPFPRHLAALFGCPRLLLCHLPGVKKWSGGEPPDSVSV